MGESRVYTAAEKRRRLILLARGAKQSIAEGADTTRVDRQIDRIDARATERWQDEASAHTTQVKNARAALAAAKAAEKAAGNGARRAARDARRNAQQALTRAERAARRFGLSVLVAVTLLATSACLGDGDKGLRCQGPAKSQVCTPYDKEK